MTKIVILTLAVITLFVSTLGEASDCGGFPQRCYLASSAGSFCPSDMPRGPECGIELTCAGKPIQLGYSSGVCFRPSCPGVWGILHERMDQASFRRRLFTYRHYTFNGHWDLKDQGVIESGPGRQRALFLVLPDDLIEFRMVEPDPCAKIVVSDLGYVKKGPVAELQRWLAYRIYMDNAESALLPAK